MHSKNNYSFEKSLRRLEQDWALKETGTRRRGQRQLKNDFIFYLRISGYAKVIFLCFFRVKTIMKLTLGEGVTLEIQQKLAVVIHVLSGLKSPHGPDEDE